MGQASHITRGGEWLVATSDPAAVMTRERITEEHRLIEQTATDFMTGEVLPRLERLAKFYNVPVDQLLPREDVTAPSEADAPSNKKLAVDLLKLTQLSGQPFEMLVRFLKMIQVQRQDFNGKVITVRGDDTRAIAAMLDVPVDQVGQRLDALDLLFRP